VIVENVGNLVCPAEFDVGAHDSVMVYAITEGEDKPLKYPVMFRAVGVVLVNKMDLLPHLDFDLDLFLRNLARVNPAARVHQVSARTGAGLDDWHAWLVRDRVADGG
jgi:hydrogenase nickel incorporation protein HypB